MFIYDFIIWPLFLVFSVYLLIFSLASHGSRISLRAPANGKKNRFLVIFPAYKEDRVIIDSVRVFLQQGYDKEYYDICVVADSMKPETIRALKQFPVILLAADYPDRSKAKAMQLAMDKTGSVAAYDSVIILDADNHTDTDFLEKMNAVYNCGIRAAQAHRTMKNDNTEIALLDGISEEINNSIFRKGHINLGFSSALIGSGMMFDYNWFKRNVNRLKTAGEDKELELILLQDQIYIAYCDDIMVYDEKIQSREGFARQRQRWINAQFDSLKTAIRLIPDAFRTKNLNLADKIFQWLMPPRLILAGGTFLIWFQLLLIRENSRFGWLLLLVIQLTALYLALPAYLRRRKLLKTLFSLVQLFGVMVYNFFRVNKKHDFIHTEHGVETSVSEIKNAD